LMAHPRQARCSRIYAVSLRKNRSGILLPTNVWPAAIANVSGSVEAGECIPGGDGRAKYIGDLAVRLMIAPRSPNPFLRNVSIALSLTARSFCSAACVCVLVSLFYDLLTGKVLTQVFYSLQLGRCLIRNPQKLSISCVQGTLQRRIAERCERI